MPKTAIKLGPKDHGRLMRLEDFDHAEVQPNYLYELSRGVITVSDGPHPRHLGQVDAARRQFMAYQLAHPERLYVVAGSGECKLLLADFESERHPDLAIYLTPPPDVPNVWAVWIPYIVIEVVSPGSEYRDYTEKLEEYLAFGVKEYWIIDLEEQHMFVFRRSRGRRVKRELGPSDTYRPRSLRGFEFACAPVFQAARSRGN